MSGPIILERTIEVHRHLLAAGIDNAIGGALALGYHTDDPRATQDIDVNVWVQSSSGSRALAALPDTVPWDEATVDRISRDDQVRIMWPVKGELPIPLDLFFAADALHIAAQARTVTVPMLDTTVQILSATDLTIFKALYDRPKDWPDILAMVSTHDTTVDLDDVIRWLCDIVGADDSRVERIRRLVGTSS